MALARINVKSIDYFKFKKLVIDGVRDDYNACSKEVKALCDCVQTLNFRDEEFDDDADRKRFEDICLYYKQIMSSKRIDPTDMRIKSGWWGDHKNAYSAGKLKPGVLKEHLVTKTKQWTERNGGILASLSEAKLTAKIDGPGLYVLKHKEHQCFQYVGRADKIFARVAEKLKAAFEAAIQEPLAALAVISMASDWDFYFIPTEQNDDERVNRILENDLILKHDCIWPHGLNFRLHIDSLLEVSEFRKSCLRHDWPPDAANFDESEIDLKKLRHQILNLPDSDPIETTPAPAAPVKTPVKKPEPRRPLSPIEIPGLPPWNFDVYDEEVDKASECGTYVVANISPKGSLKEIVPPLDLPDAAPKPKASPQPARPTSAASRKSTKSAERPKSSAGRERPTTPSGRDRPTTPKAGRDKPTTPRVRPTTPRRVRPISGNKSTPKRAANGENDVPGDESSDSSMVRSVSGTSLSSVDFQDIPSPKTTPVKRSPMKTARPARPTSGKTRGERSKLPVAASGTPLRHKNRD